MKIALTGAMGAGKTRVAALFRGQGARVVDADQIARRLLAPSASGWRALRAEFGERFFNPDLTVDRKKLRAAIFSDESLRNKVNALLHPLIREAINGICAEDAKVKADPKDGPVRKAITIVEVPLLFEVGWQDDFDLTVVVAADDKTCLHRVMSRDGVDRASAQAALAAQMSSAEKVRRADYVIDNGGAIDATARQIKDLYLKLAALDYSG